MMRAIYSELRPLQPEMEYLSIISHSPIAFDSFSTNFSLQLMKKDENVDRQQVKCLTNSPATDKVVNNNTNKQ